MNNRGYTLLFAILITSIILSVGVSILSIARKEVLLSSGAKESQTAIYMADNGLECALYWEGQNFFSTTTLAYGDDPEEVASLTCDGTVHSVTTQTIGAEWIARFPIVSRSVERVGNERRCSLVTVGGRLGSSASEFCDQINLKRVERALQFKYQ